MSRSINGNLIGAAARTNWQDIQEQAEADRQAQVERKKAQALDIAQQLRDTFESQAEYDAWWEAAPTKNFPAYVEMALAERTANQYDRTLDNLISGKVMTNEYRAQLHAEYNARFQGAS